MSATLHLFRQDPAFSGLFRAVISCLAAGLMMRFAPDLGEGIRALSANNHPEGFTPFYLLFTSMVAVFVLSSNAWTRSSRLALGLPLAARRLWVVRTGSLVAVALLSIITLAATMGLDIDARGLVLNPVVKLAALRSAATVLVLICLFQLPQSGRYRIPISAPYVVYLIGASLLTLVFSSAKITSPAGTLMFFATAGALGVYLYLRIPPTFSVGPTVDESETHVWSMPDERDFELPDPVGNALLTFEGRSPTFAVHWALFRGLQANFLTWLLLGVVVASTAVAILEFLKGTNAFLPLFFLTIYQLPIVQAALESMVPFDALPISRRVLWAHTVVPIIVAVVVGTSIALVGFVLNPLPYTQITYSDCCVKAPWDYLQLSTDGHVPTITTAWGESYQPSAHPLWKGRSVVLYDPFEVGPDSSPRFIEYQTRRAVEAVYGIPVSAEFLDPAYETPSNIAGGIDQGAFTLEETRGRSSDDRSRTAAVALLLLSILITVFMLNALLQHGASAHRKVFKRIAVGFIVLVVAGAIALSAARILGLTQVWYLGALLSIGIRSTSHVLPFSTPVLWIVCVTFWAGAYLLLERVFCTIELPREKTMNRFAEVF